MSSKPLSKISAPQSEPSTPKGELRPKPDVLSLMAGIRARVKAEVQGRRDQAPAFKGTTPDIDSKMSKKAGDLVHSEELRYLNQNYTYSSRLNLDGVSSHRPGFIGKLIVKTKQKVLRIIWDSLLRDYFAAEREYQANLVRFLNDLGQYVGGRDASMFWELVRKIDVDVSKALERIERINDEQMGSIRSSERRVFDALDESLKDIRASLGTLHTSVAGHSSQLQTLESVARGLESVIARLTPAPASSSAATPASGTPDYSYLLLENRYRGSEDEIAKRLAIYPPIFAGGTGKPVLEIGAGRGELQQLFRSAGVASYGVDTDKAMVEASKARGLDVRDVDGLKHLEEVADGSLGGVIAIQVVEHLTRDQIVRLCTLCAKKVAKGGKIIFETINPRSLMALSSNYFRDPTHVWPLHPDTLGFTMSLSGLTLVDTKFLSPVPKEAQLRHVAVEEFMTPRWAYTVETLNRNLDQLNELLFGYQDYCVIAEVK